MDPLSWVTQYGPWGLAVAAFLGATLLPVSSELAVVAALKMGMPSWQVLLSASVGNALGASLNFGIGWYLSEPTRRKLESSRPGRQALAWSDRYGRWSLLGSWLPVVGDPVCLAAGLIRTPIWFFSAVGVGTRVARYLLLIIAF